MFLKTLKITGINGLIREINFRKGLNLIIDETPNTDVKATGNNVGKTTVLMLVDFCLGASAKNIYTDPENKKQEYTIVRDFLTSNNVVIELTLKENLDVESSREVKLERNFLPRKNLIRRVNGIDKSVEEYERELTNILFPNHYPKKPTFGQIISHNIRYNEISVTNTLKILNAFTRDDEYETLYLFLLGCEFQQGDLKQELLAKLRVEENFKARLEKDQQRPAYETALSIIEDDIKKLNKKKSNLNINENLESDLQKLNQVKYQVNHVSTSISKLKIRQNLIQEAGRELKNTAVNIDSQQLQSIYSQTKKNIDGIQKTFEQLCVFHNKMIEQKIKYISEELPRLEQDLKGQSENLTRLLSEEKKLAELIAKSDSFKDLEKIITDLNDLFKKKGEYEKTISQIKEVEGNLNELNTRMISIDEELFSESFESKIKEQLSKFNSFFSSISQSLYGEKYALTYRIKEPKSGKKIYEFLSFNANMSSGKKQGEISCFDIAYTLFADQENIPCFHFLLNDKKELMHDNQLVKIGELVNEKEIQFVASILKDKLPTELNKEEYFVVKLSQADKLFRIENPVQISF